MKRDFSSQEPLGEGKFSLCSKLRGGNRGEMGMNYWIRVKALLRRKQLDRDLEDELAFHLAMREAKNRERGH